MHSVFVVAGKEFHDGLRNRWLISITVIFAILSIGLSYFGAAASGTLEVVSLSSIIASLSSLAVFLIPLIALLLSYDCFVGEQESGTLLLLLTYPLSKTQLLLGKFLGQSGIISLATLLGFGSSAVVLYLQTDNIEVFNAFGLFIFSAICLGLSFVALAYIISIIVNEKSKAAGLSLIVWFFFALVFDLGVLALLVGTEEAIDQQLLTYLMMFNPADIFRLVNLAGLENSDVNGAIAVAINSSLSQTQLFSILFAWVLGPIGLATLLFRMKKL